ncbi:hypothetical protein CerSpe_071450 [Prunus speciosa]
MVVTTMLTYIFPPPPSLFVTAMSVISFTSLASLGLSELRGKHLHYSKFWNSGSKTSAAKKIKLSSRTGMLIAYTPAFLAGVASFVLYPQENIRILLLCSALTIHFFKRIFEVLFVHSYSGGMILDSVLPISLSYFLSTATVTYAQYLTQGFPEPSVDLKYLGCLLFLIGISGNFYHHYLLSKIRSKGDKDYKIPKGGLFGLVICPHYLFEIVGFVGISLISQTLYAFSFTIGSALYLIGRSCATRRWYLSKFDHFPKNVKALIPFVL